MLSFFSKIFGSKESDSHLIECPACRRKYAEIQYQLKNGTGNLDICNFSENKSNSFRSSNSQSKPSNSSSNNISSDNLKHTCGK